MLINLYIKAGGDSAVDKTFSLFIDLDKLKNSKDSIIDLTRSMDSSLEVYSEPGYSDPEFKINDWCSIHDRGFLVSQVIMGTQTGTHIDAPAHFIEEGATMNSLIPGDLMGRYFLIDMDNSSFDESVISNYTGESFLFIKSCRSRAMLSRNFFERLLSLNAKVWVTAGECGIINEEEFSFNRGLAFMGKFLVEDLDMNMAAKISKGGYIFAMPLKLMDTGGAPCRVAVIQGKQQTPGTRKSLADY